MRWILLCLLACLAALAPAQTWQPTNGYVVDEAHILNDTTIRQINGVCDGTMRVSHVPIVVVVVQSLNGETVEGYAYNLFNQWRLGTAQNNRAALMVVSVGDRKARIELGADWGRTRNEAAQTIMNDDMVPRFKAEDYSGGILHGVQSLDQMIRTGKTPSPKLLVPILIIVAAVIVLIFVSTIIRFLTGGYSWGARHGYSSYSNYHSSSWGSSDSSWSSSDSGGGFSSGGGASGSW